MEEPTSVCPRQQTHRQHGPVVVMFMSLVKIYLLFPFTLVVYVFLYIVFLYSDLLINNYYLFLLFVYMKTEHNFLMTRILLFVLFFH